MNYDFPTFPPDLQKTFTMSKSKKIAPKPTQLAARAAATPVSKPLKNWLDRPDPAPENVGFLKKIFGILKSRHYARTNQSIIMSTI